MSKHSGRRDKTKIADLVTGRVIGRLGPVFTVECNGHDLECIARGAAKKAVVGDFVHFDPHARTELAQGLIVAIAPRKSLLQRTDALGRRPQYIAANLTQVVIVCAIEPPMREGLIDRYLITARLEGLKAIILVNKSDLISPSLRREFEERLHPYQRNGHEVFFGNCTEPTGLQSLNEALLDEISILVGHSGVGKTSVINRLLPDYDGRTNALSTTSNKGQHTTTASLLHRLPSGGELIDTPGIRSFGLYGVTRRSIADHFPDFDSIEQACRFNDCAHQHEPGCAILEAVEAGAILPHRYEAYLNLIDSADETL